MYHKKELIEILKKKPFQYENVTANRLLIQEFEKSWLETKNFDQQES